MILAVVGAGAAGITAALSAARRGARVILLEQHPRIGKKLLATGNGRCNLLNTSDPTGHYYGGGAEAALVLLRRYSAKRLLEYWESLGLICREESEGRVYPASGVANAVVDVLRRRLAEADVDVRSGYTVADIRKDTDGFIINQTLRADRVIITTGGKAGIGVGDATGYPLFKSLGVPMEPLLPSLTPIKVDPAAIRGMKGVRARANLSLLADERIVSSEEGEILFREDAVSGIAAMQLSRFVGGLASRAARIELKIDLLPERSQRDWNDWLMSHSHNTNASAEDLLRGLVHPSIAARLPRAARMDGNVRADTAPWNTIARLLRDWRLPVAGVEGFRDAQVTAGGAAFSSFDSETLECRIVPGLFAAGEALDVDGACGGFNLMWAWASGIAAGEAGSR
jgi:predicted Rossmann fold flavoprotein